MRYKFYREHKYVSFALNDLERKIAKTDFRSLAEIEKIKKELYETVEMLQGHAHYENSALHVLLKKKKSAVYKHVEKDHEHYDAILADLKERLNKVLLEPSVENRVEEGYQFYLFFRKFVGENLLHLHEEETVILPELQRLYTDAELKQVEADTYRRMTPQEMIEMMQVLFPHMNPEDKAAFLKDIQDAEPEKFRIALKGIEELLH